MKLYIGGAYQGQDELAARENPGAEIIQNFHEKVRTAILKGEDPKEFARGICLEKPDAVIVANEVGAGIVPMEASERAFREAVGRALCVIAQASDAVVRVVCGIGARIR